MENLIENFKKLSPKAINDGILVTKELILEQDHESYYGFEFGNDRKYHAQFRKGDFIFTYTPLLKEEFWHITQVLKNIPQAEYDFIEDIDGLSDAEIRSESRSIMREIRMFHVHSSEIAIKDEHKVLLFKISWDRISHRIVGYSSLVEQLAVLTRIWEEVNPDKEI